MEEPIISLVIPYHKKAYAEIQLRKRWPAWLFVYFCAGSLVWNELQWLPFWSFLPWTDRALLLFYPLCAASFFAWPFLSVFSSRRRLSRMHNGCIPEIHVQFGDTILVYDEYSRTEVPYDWVTGTRHYRYSYLLLLKGRQFLHIEEECFTKGDLDGLRALLREKCPNIKNIK